LGVIEAEDLRGESLNERQNLSTTQSEDREGRVARGKNCRKTSSYDETEHEKQVLRKKESESL